MAVTEAAVTAVFAALVLGLSVRLVGAPVGVVVIVVKRMPLGEQMRRVLDGAR